MNNLRETEKSLKRYLKSKVSITMATVVGFMIAGSVSFGATLEVNDGNKEKEEVTNITVEKFDELKGKFTSDKTNSEGQKVNLVFNGDGSITLESGIEYNSELDSDYLIKFNGVNSNLDATIEEGVKLAAKNGGIDITSAKVTNNGTIEKTDSTNWRAAVNINGAYGETEFINGINGVVKAAEGSLYAINLTSNATLTNNGTIIGNIVGEDYDTENNGTQTINLGTGSHIEGTILLKGTGNNIVNINGVGTSDKSEEVNIVTKNLSKGTIDNSFVIFGENTDIVETTGRIDVTNSTFINNGTIAAEENTEGKYVLSITDSNVTNGEKGVITAVKGGSAVVIAGVDSKFTNKGTINAIGEVATGEENEAVKDWVTKGVNNYSGATSVNEGKIIVSAITGDGMRNYGGTIINEENGIIELNSEATGLKIRARNTYTGEGKAYGHNYGLIQGNADNVIGIQLDHESNPGELSEAHNYGKIELNGNNSVGIKVIGNIAGEYYSVAINETTGVIELKGNDSIGVEVIGANSTFTNKGTIQLATESINGTGTSVGWGATFENGVDGNIIAENNTGVLVDVHSQHNAPTENVTTTVTNNGDIDAEVGITVQGPNNGIEGEGIQQIATESLIEITNTGKIAAIKQGILSNAYGNIYNPIKVTNSGKDGNGIIVEGKNSEAETYGLKGIYVASRYNGGKGEVINTGDITVIDNDSDVSIENPLDQLNVVVGLAAHENVFAENSGKIDVKADYGIGVSATSGDGNLKEESTFENEKYQNLLNEYNKFTNTGEIAVTGDNSIGLLVKSETLAKVEATNDSTGVITVNGDNAIAVRVNGANAEFTNKGKLVLGEEGTDKKAIVLENGGQATNSGIVQVLGTELDGVTSKEDALDKLFVGELKENLGIIVDKDGNALFAGSEETTVTEDTTTDILESLSDIDGSLTLRGDIILSEGASNPEVTTDVLNVTEGTTTVASNNEVNIEAENINMDDDGKFAVEEDATLGLANGSVNKSVDGEVIENNGTLNLTNMDVNGDIVGTTGTVNAYGENTVNGKVEGTFNIGSVAQSFLRAASTGKTNVVTATSNSSFGGNINIATDGQLVLELGKDNVNALSNSNGITVTGTNNDDIALNTSSISEKEVTISLGKDNTFQDVDVTTTTGDNGIYVVDDNNLNSTGEVILTYNQDLYKDTNTTINNMNKEAYAVNGYFSQDVATREKQLDNLYANNIYSETVRAAYDMMKLNEESVLSLNADAKAGEWAAAGKVLYNKTEYDRTGTIGEYTSEIETSGLMAGLEYGVNESTSVGVAISGAYQDIDTDNGEADGKLFYLGVYGKKEIGKLKLTAGLGYQYGDYDADNKVASIASSESYDVNAYSAYLEGRYGIDLGDNVTFEPKLKLGYTYVDQDNVSDDYFRLSDSELSTFDAEIGADLVKTVALKSGRLDVRFGASYVRAFGDTDDKFTGSFAGSTGNFEVLGAELSEDTAKFDLGVEVSKDSGIFYNLGGTLRVGSDNTRDYGVKLGAGYKF